MHTIKQSIKLASNAQQHAQQYAQKHEQKHAQQHVRRQIGVAEDQSGRRPKRSKTASQRRLASAERSSTAADGHERAEQPGECGATKVTRRQSSRVQLGTGDAEGRRGSSLGGRAKEADRSGPSRGTEPRGMIRGGTTTRGSQNEGV